MNNDNEEWNENEIMMWWKWNEMIIMMNVINDNEENESSNN